MSRLLWILMLILLVGTAVGASWAFKQGNPFTAPDKSEVLSPAPPPPTVVALGFVDGDPAVAKLTVFGQGTIKEVIGEGTQVAKGDVLLRLDEGLAKATLDEANADLNAAKEKHTQALDLPKQHELKVKQQQQAIAAHDAKRKGVKLEQDRMLQQAKDTGTKVNPRILEGLEESLKHVDALIEAEKLKLEEIKLFKPQSEINRALADVQAKEAQVAKAQWALDQCKLEAASDGLVLRVNVAVGEVLVPNLPGRAPPIEFLPKGPKIVRAEVLQEWAHLVKIGHDVDIEDDSYQGPTWKGKVRFLSYWFAEKRHRIMEPFMLNDVRTLECIVEVTQEDPLLRIGQRVKVKIKTK
jgi:multidrug resistance efflux pump